MCATSIWELTHETFKITIIKTNFQYNFSPQCYASYQRITSTSCEKGEKAAALKKNLFQKCNCCVDVVTLKKCEKVASPKIETKIHIRKFCSVTVGGFWFENCYFFLSACCSYPCYRSCHIHYGLVADIWHQRRSLIILVLIQSPTQKVGIGLVVKLQTIQQRTTLMTFFQIRRV